MQPLSSPLPTITPTLLAKLVPRCPPMRLEAFAELLDDAMRERAIDTIGRGAAFVAETSHESDGFRRWEECLDYSIPLLRRTLPRIFSSDELAAPYAHNPERLANRVYANRMGNGDAASGDGWRYRGHGIIQLTGRANHREAGVALGLDLEGNPELAAQWHVGFRVAAWYWHTRNLNAPADLGDLAAITRAINGGLIGHPQREAAYRCALVVLGAA